MKSLWLTGVMTALVAVAPAASQERKDDRFEKAVFDPQLVLQRARDIGLTSQQRQQILEVVKKIQTELVPIQLEMAEPSLELVELLEQDRVDEAAAVAKVAKVLEIENEVKKLQTALLVRIKNILTREQQARLRAIRDGGRSNEQDGDAKDHHLEGVP
jgi:Spy/CpxP family protein refolding chaperone